MKLLIISDAPILSISSKKEAYAPYVREMDLWLQHASNVSFVCPTRYNRNLLTQPFLLQNFNVTSLRRLEFHNIFSSLRSLTTLPYQAIVLGNAMRKADHIHLRAPGNLCLLACLIQILFPSKKKTTKYAGNWDPKAKQPLAYRMQKWLLSNTFLTKNMQVLVYGEWEGMTKNIIPFFTASYFDSAKENVADRNFKGTLKALFVGTMGNNKRPLETVQLIHSLRKKGVNISLEMFGEGPVSDDIKWYRKENGLQDHILLRGNQPAEIVKEAYKQAHFVILLSQSEGWPKVVAEAMFWGAIPIVTKVSCVPWMLDQGKRGFLIQDHKDVDIDHLIKEFDTTDRLEDMSQEAMKWSRKYTMDTFAKEIEKLLQ